MVAKNLTNIPGMYDLIFLGKGGGVGRIHSL